MGSESQISLNRQASRIVSLHSPVSFDISVLHGPTGLYILNLNFMFFTPSLKFFGCEFRVVVRSDDQDFKARIL